jgi:AI-2E family transporter
MLAMILRFVPYIGAVISAIFPLILSAAVGPDWGMVIWTAALFASVEPIVGHVIEPMLYGQSTGLSPVAVITSATFWTWLWGPIGLVLATPLTVCLVVLGRHVDRLKFLDVMFGDKPPLKPEELVYQRLLAGDPTEAADQARRFLKAKPLLYYYQDVLMEGLKLAQADANKGLLDDERTLRIRDTVAVIVDDFDSLEDTTVSAPLEPPEGSSLPPPGELQIQSGIQVPEEWRNAKRVLCIPGLGQLDEAAALIVAQLTER